MVEILSWLTLSSGEGSFGWDRDEKVCVVWTVVWSGNLVHVFKMLTGSVFCVVWSPELGGNMLEAEKENFDVFSVVLHVQEGEMLV